MVRVEDNGGLARNADNQNATRVIRRCAFVLPEGSCRGEAAPGSAYCGPHRGLCEPPEPIEEDDAERLAGLDLPRPQPRHDE